MLAAVLGTAVLGGWSILSSYRMLHPVSASWSGQPPLSARSHLLTLPSGKSFDVWIFQADAPRGIVIGCHGYKGSRM